MSDATLWACPDCDVVQAEFTVGDDPDECPVCGFEDERYGSFKRAGGVSR